METKSSPAINEEGKQVTNKPSAYAILKIDEEADFFSVYKKLYFTDKVLYCDAVRGDIDIFILLQAESMEGCKTIFDTLIKTLPEVKEARLLPVSSVHLNNNLPEDIRNSKEFVCSYILANAEEEKISDICEVLQSNENVAFCKTITGKYDMIIMVHGAHYNRIDKFIENNLLNLDGILKIKEYPVINIYEM